MCARVCVRVCVYVASVANFVRFLARCWRTVRGCDKAMERMVVFWPVLKLALSSWVSFQVFYATGHFSTYLQRCWLPIRNMSHQQNGLKVNCNRLGGMCQPWSIHLGPGRFERK